MAFNVTTTGLNVTLEDLGITLNHPQTLDLLSDGIGFTDIIDSQDLVNAIRNGNLIASDDQGNPISEVDFSRIITSIFSRNYLDLINVPVNVDAVVIEDKNPSSTFELAFKGFLLDYINNVNLSGALNSAGISTNIVSKKFDEAIVSVTVNATEQTYTLDLLTNEQTFSFNFDTRLIIGTGVAGTTVTGFDGNNITPFNQAGTFNWSFSTGGTPSSGTGATNPPTGSTTYAFAETSDPVTQQDNFILETSDFALLTQVTFQYHMFGASMGILRLQYSNDNGVTWIDKLVLQGQQQPSQNSDFIEETVDFTSTPATNLRFFFDGRLGFASDCCITDINITSV